MVSFPVEKRIKSKVMTYIRKEDGTCKCGRSPTGDCIGWHKLTEEQYQEKTEEDKGKIIKEAEEKKNK